MANSIHIFRLIPQSPFMVFKSEYMVFIWSLVPKTKMYEVLLILFSGNKCPLHIEKQNHYYYFEAKVYLELSRTSMMERFETIVHSF